MIHVLIQYFRHCSGLEIKPNPLRKVDGLRERVIRALYLCHPAFVSRCLPTAHVNDETEMLIGQRCLNVWFQKVKDHFTFFFAFEYTKEICPLTKIQNGGKYEGKINMHRNKDESRSILQVVCEHYQDLQQVSGALLLQAGLSVGQTMRSHRLRLTFGEQKVKGQGYSTNLVLDPVSQVHVRRWWQPSYPKKLQGSQG